MKFKMNVRFLGCKVDTLSDGKTAYYTLTLFDPESKTTFDTGFISNRDTEAMENLIMDCSFGDELACELILRKAEKDNRYKIGLRSVS